LPPFIVLLPPPALLPLALPPVELAPAAGEALPGSELSPQPNVAADRVTNRIVEMQGGFALNSIMEAAAVAMAMEPAA
jgi:hypothetical protein